MKRKTQQIFIKNLSYPYESVHVLFFDSDFIKKIFFQKHEIMFRINNK